MEVICARCAGETDSSTAMPDPETNDDLCFECYEKARYEFDDKRGRAFLRSVLPSMPEFMQAYSQRNRTQSMDPSSLAGNCHAAAHTLKAMMEERGIKCKVKRGHWTAGDVRPDRAHYPFQQHSWNELTCPDNDIVFFADPTQFVFTGGPQEIALSNEDDRRYDPGGYNVREVFGGERQMPDRAGQTKKSNLSAEACKAIARIYGDRDWTIWTRLEMGTLANTRPSSFHGYAKEIFQAIIGCGGKALIPIDACEEVLAL